MMMIDQVNAIHAFGEQIGTKLARAEELGAEGSVEESLQLMEEVEALKKQKAEAEVCVECVYCRISKLCKSFCHACELPKIMMCCKYFYLLT